MQRANKVLAITTVLLVMALALGACQITVIPVDPAAPVQAPAAAASAAPAQVAAPAAQEA